MKSVKTLIATIATTLLFLASSQADDFTYATNNGTITITGYTGARGAVAIPGTVFGLPITGIGYQAFFNQTNVTSVAIPSNGQQHRGHGIRILRAPDQHNDPR